MALTPSAATQAPRGRGQAARPVWVALSSAVGGNPDSRLPWSRYRGQRYPRGRAAPAAPCSLRPRSLQPAAHARPRVGPQSPRDVRTGASPLPAFSPSGTPHPRALRGAANPLHVPGEPLSGGTWRGRSSVLLQAREYVQETLSAWGQEGCPRRTPQSSHLVGARCRLRSPAPRQNVREK